MDRDTILIAIGGALLFALCVWYICRMARAPKPPTYEQSLGELYHTTRLELIEQQKLAEYHQAMADMLLIRVNRLEPNIKKVTSGPPPAPPRPPTDGYQPTADYPFGPTNTGRNATPAPPPVNP